MGTLTRTKLEVVPVTEHIGAEIRGLDLRARPDDATIRAIYQAWLDHLVIVFPGQDLSQEELIRALESLRTACPLSTAEAKALDRRVARELYWNLGYALLWQGGQWARALAAFRRGLSLQPGNVAYWKVYVLAGLRTLLRLGPASAA